MFNKLYSFINDDCFRLIVCKENIHICNYIDIKVLKNDFVSIEGDSTINIRGKGLVLKKLLDSELLITGVIYSIEVVHD